MAIQQKYLAQKVFTIQQILLAKSLGDLLQFRIITFKRLDTKNHDIFNLSLRLL